MTALLRSASLTGFAELAAEFGLDAAALVAEVELPPRCLRDPDLKVPASKVGRLLELAARRAREPAFGLRMAESRRLSNLAVAARVGEVNFGTPPLAEFTNESIAAEGLASHSHHRASNCARP